MAKKAYPLGPKKAKETTTWGGYKGGIFYPNIRWFKARNFVWPWKKVQVNKMGRKTLSSTRIWTAQKMRMKESDIRYRAGVEWFGEPTWLRRLINKLWKKQVNKCPLNPENK